MFVAKVVDPYAPNQVNVAGKCLAIGGHPWGRLGHGMRVFATVDVYKRTYKQKALSVWHSTSWFVKASNEDQHCFHILCLVWPHGDLDETP